MLTSIYVIAGAAFVCGLVVFALAYVQERMWLGKSIGPIGFGYIPGHQLLHGNQRHWLHHAVVDPHTQARSYRIGKIWGIGLMIAGVVVAGVAFGLQ